MSSDQQNAFEPWSTERTEMAKKAIAERDRLKATVIKLVSACQSLMGEITNEGSTDWGVVNEAMVEGEAVVRLARKET